MKPTTTAAPETMHKTGKTIARHVYLHLCALDAATQALAEAAARLAQAKPGEDFNVLKLSDDGQRLSLLDYPGFFDEAFPPLRRYWTVDLGQSSARFRTYADSLNPPILHRKELLLPPAHPQREAYARLTAAAELAGLFDDPCRIGFKRAWDELLAQRGYRVVGHELLTVGNDESAEPAGADAGLGVARHLTALSRQNFSVPVQTLARFGLLDGKTVFDYGCGRGDDVRGLCANGISASGWDPYYAADAGRHSADIVNLGFVINVIEDPDERLHALLAAYALAGELLVVAAMLANPEAVRGKSYSDGVLTARNTFQKYYTQTELRDYLADALGCEPLPVGPGIFYVFKDQDAEQRFLSGRQENRRRVLRLAQLSKPAGPKAGSRPSKAEEKYRQHQNILDPLWQLCLSLGRDPERAEIPEADALADAFGTIAAALRCVKSRQENASAVLEQARQSRIDDLRIYFAQMHFAQRPAYRHLESRLQTDVKAFFGDYRAAQASGLELLFAAGRPESVAAACREAAERGVGWLEEGESLQLPTACVAQLPPVLRTYIVCGLRLYGDPGAADLLKIHIRSGKLSLMRFDDFTGRPLPKLTQRVKINLRTQAFEVFDYGDVYEPPYLFRKSRLINEEFPHYAEQLAFDEALENLGLFDLSGYGPNPKAFDGRLETARWVVDGFRLRRSQTIPALDARCGQYFTYRHLIECGETQSAHGLPNLPRQPDSYSALRDLAVAILDPVLDYFGMIRLTYGFCSPALARLIPARIVPKLDQHSAHELNAKGQPLCPRLGAAVDFIIPDEDMRAVALWIAENTPFDRLYYYGPDKPLHVSHSQTPAREFVEMRETEGGKRVPRVVKDLSAWGKLDG
ncbi:MAG: DNA phosphorothioation-associated putative methyltransferase [Candidatus Methylumidiphilus sp.]